MLTAAIQIGNTDNKLTQQEWSRFAADFRAEVRYLAGDIYFDGACEGTQPWQNLCMVISTQYPDELRIKLAALADQYRQDSIALLLGSTEMVAAKG